MRENVTVHRVVKTLKPAGSYVEPHSHHFFHFAYMLSGEQRIEVEGKAYTAKADTLMLIPPETVHSILVLSDSGSIDLKFSCSGQLTADAARLPRCIPALDAAESAIIRGIFEEAVSTRSRYDEMAGAEMYRLLILLLRGQESPAGAELPLDAPATAEDKQISLALGYIEDHLQQPLHISELARKFGYSENYFRMYFKEQTGVSPNRYISQRRIGKAKELLLYSDRNVTQISDALGYQSIHYFSRQFKALTGLTPSEYLEKTRGNRIINVINNENTPEGEFDVEVRRGGKHGRK